MRIGDGAVSDKPPVESDLGPLRTKARHAVSEVERIDVIGNEPNYVSRLAGERPLPPTGIPASSGLRLLAGGLRTKIGDDAALLSFDCGPYLKGSLLGTTADYSIRPFLEKLVSLGVGSQRRSGAIRH